MNIQLGHRARWWVGALALGVLTIVAGAIGARSARAVGVTPSTITVVANVNPAVYGQSVTLTATVASSTPGGPVPTGNVTFMNGTAALTTKKLVGGTVAYTTTYSVGTRSITGVYNGDATYAISTSPPFDLAVNQTPTTTTLTSSSNPSNYPETVTITGTVAASAPGNGMPSSGSLKFYEGATLLATRTPAAGIASFSFIPGIGTHTITAVFGGSTSYLPSTSAPFNQTVNPASSATSVSSSSATSTFGANVTFTATVTSTLAAPTGSVTFTDGASPLGTAAIVNGTASLSASTLTVGTHTITAAYAGTVGIQPSSGIVSQIIQAAPTTTTVSATPSPAGLGQPVTLHATVTTGAGTLTGTVTFSEGPTPLGSSPVVSGSADLTVSTLAAGSHTIGATYDGDAAHSTSAAGTALVILSPTTTTLIATTDTNPVGTSVTFTATVTSPGGSATGTLTFFDGSTAVGTAPVTNGEAALTTSALTAGAHLITAGYSGDAAFAASTSSPLTHTVTADTSTTLGAAPTPSTFGGSVTFTATVASLSGTPTGTVTFRDGPAVLGTGALINGQTTFTTASLATGAHGVTAAYGGDTAFAASVSAALAHTVTPAETTTVLSALPVASTLGDPVAFTATVTPVNPGPAGNVVLFDGANAIASAPIQNGSAQFTITTLGLGTHTLTASFAGATDYSASTSPAVSFTVAANSTTTTITGDANPVPYGTAVVFTATVSAGAGNPSGSVSFTAGSTPLGTATLANGQATLTATGLEPGTIVVTASYSGDSSFAPSVSSGLSQTIDRAASSVALTVAPNPVVATDSVTLAVTVSSNAGTPTGSVTFRDGTADLGTSPLVNGHASLPSSFVAAGTHSISALYIGDSRFASATSTTVAETVTAAPTSTTLAASPNPASSGQTVILSASVTSSRGVPAGTIAFSDGATTLGVGSVLAGQASLSTTSLAAGPHSITATYSGSATFAASTSPIVVETITTSLVYVDQANPACKTTGVGAGSLATPYCTINAAAAKVVPGVTVQVASGTYAEKVTVGGSGTAAAPITITPAPGATVTVFGGANGFVVTNKSWIIIRGFAVDAAKNAGIAITGGTNVTLDANHVTHSGLPVSGSTAVGIKVSGTTNSLIANNITDHNSDAGILVTTDADNNVVTHNESYANARGYVRAAAGIDLRNSTGTIVTANIVHDNEDSGINMWTGLTNGSNLASNNVVYRNGDHGIDCHNATDVRVIANTVYSNSDSGIEMTTSTGSLLANNISVDNGIGSLRTAGNIRADSASSPTATVNDDQIFLRVPGIMVDWGGVKYASLAAFRAATGQESRGVEADPLFTGPNAGNFHLLSGSLAIDAANTTVPGQPAIDFDGQVRYDDAKADTGIGPVTYADRGAFEYRP